MSKDLTESEINDLKAKLEELRPIVSKFYELSNLISSETDKLDKKKFQRELDFAASMADYQEPTYPAIGVEAQNGSAILKDQEQAEKLVKALNQNGGYWNRFFLEWTGEGVYDVIPDYAMDHDGDLVYKTYFKKKVE